MNNNEIEFIVESRKWTILTPSFYNFIKKIIKFIYIKEGLSNVPNISILFTNKDHIKKLNFRFRNLNKPTNILSFEHLSPHYGGELALSYDTIYKEAILASKPFKWHLIHLIIHGILHLNGYDHSLVSDAIYMEMKEAYYMRQFNFPNPWKIMKK